MSQFLVNTVIGFEKFQNWFPMCGGKVKIALLTPREFKFLNVKEEDPVLAECGLTSGTLIGGL
ncbi:MAG: hypothetical protein ACTSRG_25715 [Candidatus Helarchaeota archaeon]